MTTLRTITDLKTTVATLAALEFTGRDAYLAWRKLWKTTYADLTQTIRHHKAHRKASVVGEESAADHAAQARKGRETARSMLEDVLAAGRAKAAQQVADARKATEVAA